MRSLHDVGGLLWIRHAASPFFSPLSQPTRFAPLHPVFPCRLGNLCRLRQIQNTGKVCIPGNGAGLEYRGEKGV